MQIDVTNGKRFTEYDALYVQDELVYALDQAGICVLSRIGGIKTVNIAH